LYQLSLIADNDFVEELEEEYDCSGLCRPPLFWLTKSIEEGKPKKTCLTVVSDIIHEAATPYSNSCIIGAVTALFAWMLHFGLYCRPDPQPPKEPHEGPIGLDQPG
jgi:hypothetical protein